MTPEEMEYWSRQNHQHKTSRQHTYYINRRYGISAAQFENQMIKQGGLCAVCKDPPSSRRLSIDHDEKTGENRGLLCTRCNVGLGYFRDNIAHLKSAITYLEAAELRWENKLKEKQAPIVIT